MRALDENKLRRLPVFRSAAARQRQFRTHSRVASTARKARPRTRAADTKAARTSLQAAGFHRRGEIDAASHNGVDDARELRGQYPDSPPAATATRFSFSTKLTPDAPQEASALLKIVEEPPEHVMFIFATTEPDKVIGTIRSRTHHLPVPCWCRRGYGPVPRADLRRQAYREARPGVLRLAMRAAVPCETPFPCLTSSWLVRLTAASHTILRLRCSVSRLTSLISEAVDPSSADRQNRI